VTRGISFFTGLFAPRLVGVFRYQPQMLFWTLMLYETTSAQMMVSFWVAAVVPIFGVHDAAGAGRNDLIENKQVRGQ